MPLVDFLIKDGWLKTPRIAGAFKKIKRSDFMPPLAESIGGGLEDTAELNEAFPIGCGQTISQPLTVAFMFELLQPEPGDKILDVGSGSGWTTAILSEIAGNEGRVFALEIVPELKKLGENNVGKYNFIKKGIARFVLTDGSRGYEKYAPYDKILCSAAVQGEVPPAWKEQLKIGGRIVAPIRSSIWLFVKKSAQNFEKTEFPGFAFVPLIEK